MAAKSKYSHEAVQFLLDEYRSVNRLVTMVRSCTGIEIDFISPRKFLPQYRGAPVVPTNLSKAELICVLEGFVVQRARLTALLLDELSE